MATTAQSKSEVTAVLNYLADRSIDPVWHRSAEEGDNDWHEGVFGALAVPIHDAREVADELSLDRNGFVFTRSPTSVEDFSDLDAIRETYSTEMEALIRDLTGADLVLQSDLCVRSPENPQPFLKTFHQVHSDYTDETALEWARRLLMDGGSDLRVVREPLSSSEADAVLQRRFAEYNIWRPIDGPVMREPLAVLDTSTVAPDDVMRCRSEAGDILLGVYNPAHRWYYAPEMRSDEVLVFKCYDTATDGRARFAMHSAFHHPDTRPEAPIRRSIEVRAFVFYDD